MGIPKSLQIFLASLSASSVCRGTDDIVRLAGFQ
jgi:hypothetical protein